MLPFEFIDELPEDEPLIELPDEDEEPLPIELPEPVLPEPIVEPELEPVPIVLPELDPDPVVLPEPVVDGLVLLFDVDDDGLVVPVVLLLPGVVVVVVVVLGVPIVPLPVVLDGVVDVLLPDDEGVVLLPEGVVLLLPDGVVVVLGLVLDCAMAAPPTINNDAAATAVVVLKNEPMVRTPVWLKRKAHRSAAVQSSAMSDAMASEQRLCPTGAVVAVVGHQVFTRARHADCLCCHTHPRSAEVSMVTSSTSYPSSPSTSSTSAGDYSRASGDDAMGTAASASAGSMSSTVHPSSASTTPELMDRVVRGAHETVDTLADKAKPQLQRLQEGAGNASDAIHARVDQAREMGDEWAEALRDTVRDHPLAAIGTALALGLIVARLSR